MIRLDMVPPVLVWIFHGPTAQFTDDAYLDALSDIAKAFRELTGNNHRSYMCIGGADFNCQVGVCRGAAGKFSKGESPGEVETARAIYGFLADQGMKIANAFVDVGFTRYPPSDLLGHHPSPIDGIAVSRNLAFWFIGKGPLPFEPPSDHVPLGCQIVVRRPSRRYRVRVFNSGILGQSGPRKSASTWQPRDQGSSKIESENAVLERQDIEGFACETLQIAMEERHWEEKPEDGELQHLFGPSQSY